MGCSSDDTLSDDRQDYPNQALVHVYEESRGNDIKIGIMQLVRFQ